MSDGALGAASSIAWSGYAEPTGVTSVPRYLEQHAERLRAKYLAFVHDLGERSLGGRRLREHFTVADGYSFWWMNRVAEKSPFKSPRIFDCLRLLALEEILVAQRATSATLVTGDVTLRAAVDGLCRGLEIPLETVESARVGPAPAARWYDRLPLALQGLLSLRHLVSRWPFRRLRAAAWFGGTEAVFFGSYLYHLDKAATARGAFHSHQWEDLPDMLHAHGRPTNWVQHYQPDGPLSIKETTALLSGFNARADREGRHALVETFVSLGAVLKIIGLWLWLNGLRWRLREAHTLFRPSGSAAWLWPLLAQDWRLSLSGTAAVSNCTWYVLFDRALSETPRQSRGLYLYEGQGWESALVHAWRKHGHGEVVAVPHSSMPFWYLNIYDDPRCVARDGECAKPTPDRWALNGPMAWKAMTSAGYPAARLAPVEALRYTYLRSFAATRQGDAAAQASGTIRLLVLGDYTATQTLEMLARVADAAPAFDGRLAVTVKLHPACVLDPAAVAGLDVRFTTAALADILGDVDLAFASNTTSAGLDALIAGLPVLVFLDDATFNQSPLRGSAAVTFVSTTAELIAGVMASAGHRVASTADEFFWLDAGLPRWRQLLGVTQESHV